MLDPTILPSWNANSNSRRKSFFDFLEPTVGKPKPRSNSMGVIEAPRYLASQRFSYQSPSFQSTPYQTTPYPRQRTKCFGYPSFSSENFDSPVMVVTGGSPSVLDYGRMMSKFSIGVNKKYGRCYVATLLMLSLVIITCSGFHYYKDSLLSESNLFIPTDIFQFQNQLFGLSLNANSGKSFVDDNKNTKMSDSPNNQNSKWFTLPRTVPTIVGQHKSSLGFAKINKVAKEKINLLEEGGGIRQENFKGTKEGAKEDEMTNNKDALLKEVNLDRRRNIPEKIRENPKGLKKSEREKSVDRASYLRHQHGTSPFMRKETEWAENRLTIQTNRRKEDIWRNGEHRNYQPQHSQRRTPAEIIPPPGINPKIYDRNYDF